MHIWHISKTLLAIVPALAAQILDQPTGWAMFAGVTHGVTLHGVNRQHSNWRERKLSPEKLLEQTLCKITAIPSSLPLGIYIKEIIAFFILFQLFAHTSNIDII